MAKADDLSLLDPRFTDAEAAAEYLESIRWPNGVVCPKCGEAEREPYRLKGKSLKKRRVWKCRACRQQFTVTVGTIFESSHVPLNKWLAAFYLLCSSKKGLSAHQLHRMIDVTYKTAWFMFHRIREAMGDPAFSARLSGVVEIDETYIGSRRKGKRGRPAASDKKKMAVMSLVERSGRTRSFRMANVSVPELRPAISRTVNRSARVMTDGFGSYRGLDAEFASHETVDHTAGEYARGDVHVNSAESYFATLKRGINGIYHHVSEAHLHRYLSEFDFRASSRHVSDGARTRAALAGAEGKRLKYREPTGESRLS